MAWKERSRDEGVKVRMSMEKELLFIWHSKSLFSLPHFLKKLLAGLEDIFINRRKIRTISCDMMFVLIFQ